MRPQKIARAIAGGIFIALAYSSAQAQPPVITSLQGNGQLTWTNPAATNGFTVQWAPVVTGPWFSNWNALDSLITSNMQTTVPVPMFYRVAQGFSSASMRGTWISSGPGYGNTYLIAQEDGIWSESSMINPSRPAGYFTVGLSGRVTNTFLSPHDSAPMTSSGSFSGANLIAADPPYTNNVLRRVENTAWCAGNWTGTLVATNTASSDFGNSYPVSFSVDTRGLVTNFTGINNFPDFSGFTGVTVGRMFALTNGVTAGFFYPGDKSFPENGTSQNSYNQISISGTLIGNAFVGSYGNDSGQAMVGTASFTRQ